MPYRFTAEAAGGPTPAEKTQITQDFALETGRTAASGITKAKWLDNVIDRYVDSIVRGKRLRDDKATREAALTADLAKLVEP